MLEQTQTAYAESAYGVSPACLTKLRPVLCGRRFASQDKGHAAKTQHYRRGGLGHKSNGGAVANGIKGAYPPVKQVAAEKSDGLCNRPITDRDVGKTEMPSSPLLHELRRAYTIQGQMSSTKSFKKGPIAPDLAEGSPLGIPLALPRNAPKKRGENENARVNQSGRDCRPVNPELSPEAPPGRSAATPRIAAVPVP